ncbi:MAG: hypothetical protein AAB692_00075 [Patescibacteria group bacterium]
MPVIAVLVALGYAAAAYFLVILPRLRQVSAGGEFDVKSVEDQLTTETAYAGSVAKAVKDYQAVNPALKEKVFLAMPAEKGIPEVLAALEDLSARHGMVIVSLDAVVDEKTVLPSGEKVVSIAMNLTGAEYKTFKVYLADLQRSLRIFDLQSLVFAPKTGSFNLSLKAYYLEPL